MSTTPANCTSGPVYGQLSNIKGLIKLYGTGNPLTGNLTGLAAAISKDDASFVATTNTPVEILDSVTGLGSGYFTLDLTAAECTCAALLVRVSASNAGSIVWSRLFTPLWLQPVVGPWDAQTPKRFEQMVTDIMDNVISDVTTSNLQNSGNYQVMNRANVVKMSGTYSENSDGADKGRLDAPA